MPFYVIDIKSISIHALREEGDDKTDRKGESL